jgi:hypothetical protein
MRAPRSVSFAAVFGVLVYVSLGSPSAPMTSSNPRGQAVQVGVTFSPREATYRNLPWRETFNAALDASPALVRLGVYWNEVEAKRGTYDFSTVDWLLDQASARQQRVLLTIGMKAPRWPEYYFPDWLAHRLAVAERGVVSNDVQVQTATRALLKATVEHVRDRSVVAAWQVENEPLDTAGPHLWRIGAGFLAEEIALVRSLDTVRQRPIVVNTFVDTQPGVLLPSARSAVWSRAQAALATADVLGLDVYPSRTLRLFGSEITVRWPAWIWSGLLADMHDLAETGGKDAWIVEVQAEPWTSTGGRLPPPAWPGAVVAPSSLEGEVGRLEAAGYRTILLWGMEHWEAQRSLSQDSSWWAAASAVFGRTSSCHKCSFS